MPERKNDSEKKKILFLIDYDIPENSDKRKFYEELKKMDLTKSTRSVVLTSDLETAKRVRKKATNIGGRANFYKVKKKRKA